VRLVAIASLLYPPPLFPCLGRPLDGTLLSDETSWPAVNNSMGRRSREAQLAASVLSLFWFVGVEAWVPGEGGTYIWGSRDKAMGRPLASLASPRREHRLVTPRGTTGDGTRKRPGGAGAVTPTGPDTGFRPLAARDECRRALLRTNFAPGDKNGPSFSKDTLRPLRQWERLAQDSPWALPDHVLTQPVMYAAGEAPHSVISGYRKCAIVGSAGVLKGSKWGRMVDDTGRYDAIIRLNNAPTRGYEAHVGSRTTIRFIHDWHLSPKNLPEVKRTEGGGVVMVWPSPTVPHGPRAAFGGPAPGERTKVSSALKELQNAGTNVTMSRISDLMYHTSAIIGQRHNGKYQPYVPSSGWYSVFAALNMCSSLDVIGYSWESAQETLERRRKATGDGRGKGTAYYFEKHANGLKDEDAYYRSRYERNPMSFHDLVKENGSIRFLADSCGFRMR